MVDAIKMSTGAEPAPDPAKVPDTAVETPTGVQIVPPAAADATPTRPAWLPEKFKSAEDLAAAYAALEAKQGAPETVTPEQAAQKVKDAGLDMVALAQEYAAGGKLSDDTVTKLAAKGITKEAINSYIEGQKAIGERMRTEAATVVGGEEQLAAVLEWARANLSAAEKAAYDAAVDSGNMDTVKLALAGVAARYSVARPQEPRLVSTPTTPGSPGVEPFRSSAQVSEAIRDRRYQTDPAYRKAVEDRLRVTQMFD